MKKTTTCSRTRGVASYLAIPPIALALLLGGCGGGGGGLDAEGKAMASAVATEAGVPSSTAECLVAKLDADGRATLRNDTNLSELNGASGQAVAAAYAVCAGQSFSSDFGYDVAS